MELSLLDYRSHFTRYYGAVRDSSGSKQPKGPEHQLRYIVDLFYFIPGQVCLVKPTIDNRKCQIARPDKPI